MITQLVIASILFYLSIFVLLYALACLDWHVSLGIEFLINSHSLLANPANPVFPYLGEKVLQFPAAVIFWGNRKLHFFMCFYTLYASCTHAAQLAPGPDFGHARFKSWLQCQKYPIFHLLKSMTSLAVCLLLYFLPRWPVLRCCRSPQERLCPVSVATSIDKNIRKLLLYVHMCMLCLDLCVGLYCGEHTFLAYELTDSSVDILIENRFHKHVLMMMIMI